MGNIAFHVKDRPLEEFYALSLKAMANHIDNHVVADSALWMIANYYSFSSARSNPKPAIELISKCVRLHPEELKLHCGLTSACLD